MLKQLQVKDQVVVCTVATPDRSNYTKVLLEDVARHEGYAHVLVLRLGSGSSDIEPPTESERVSVLTPQDIGVGDDELSALKASRLPNEEYSLAFRPWIMSTALSAGAAAAIYVADDFHLLGPLTPIHERARAVGACFMRRSRPLGNTARTLPLSGAEAPAIDLDLFAVSPPAARFLSDWQDATMTWRGDRGFRANQHVDVSAGDMPGTLVADPLLDFGWWNHDLLGPATEESPDPRELGVRALHLHGFDAWRPHLIGLEPEALPALPLSRWPALAALCRDYAARVRAAGRPPLGYGPRLAPSASETRHQLHLSPLAPHEDRFALRCLQRGRDAANAGRWPHPPDPDSCDRTTWLAWLNSPPEGSQSNVSRYLMEVYRARRDVRLAFPDLEADSAQFLAWARTHGRHELHIPSEVLPSGGGGRPTRAKRPSAPEFGVNVVGLFESHLGLGEAARQLLSALAAAGIPYRTWDYGQVESPRFSGGAGLLHDGPLFPINILCLNPPELANLIHHVGPALRRHRYNIGVWAWETEEAPASWIRLAPLVDEVWAPSQYVAVALGKMTGPVVQVIPHAVSVPYHPHYMDREYLGLPDAFVSLFIFDFNSSTLRKNAVGLVRAYRAAFSSSDGTALVIKTLNAATHPGDWEELVQAAESRPDVIIHDRVLAPMERAALLDACDCYISLHRAEGFGLTMAEAMALGKPVIATAYSGNMDFMDVETSFLVGFDRVAVGVPWDRYPADHIWAEPKAEEATEALRRVWRDRKEAAQRSALAKQAVTTRLAPAVVGAQMRTRLTAVWHARVGELSARPSLVDVVERVRRAAGRRLLGRAS